MLWPKGIDLQELTVGDLIHATEDDNPVRKLNERAMQECLDKLLSTFCPRNAGIIRALYNLEEHTDQMTLQKHVGFLHIMLEPSPKSSSSNCILLKNMRS